MQIPLAVGRGPGCHGRITGLERSLTLTASATLKHPGAGSIPPFAQIQVCGGPRLRPLGGVQASLGEGVGRTDWC